MKETSMYWPTETNWMERMAETWKYTACITTTGMKEQHLFYSSMYYKKHRSREGVKLCRICNKIYYLGFDSFKKRLFHYFPIIIGIQ